jgi:ammonia channel protein AmtB
MNKRKRNLLYGLVGFLCGLVVVITAASATAGSQSKAQVIGLIAGSFGCGAALVNAIRDYKAPRSRAE